MPYPRRIEGEVVFPPDAANRKVARIIVELRDVSLQDRPSTVIASKIMTQVVIGPNARVPFEMNAPATVPNRSLAMRVQVDTQTNSRSAAGDFLSTVNVSVPAKDDVRDLLVPVTRPG